MTWNMPEDISSGKILYISPFIVHKDHRNENAIGRLITQLNGKVDYENMLWSHTHRGKWTNVTKKDADRRLKIDALGEYK